MTRSTTLARQLRSIAAATLFTVLVAVSLGGSPASALVPPPDTQGSGAPASVLSPADPTSQSAQAGDVGLAVVVAITLALLVIGAVAWARAARRARPRLA